MSVAQQAPASTGFSPNSGVSAVGAGPGQSTGRGKPLDALDQYVSVAPSLQTALDVFDGQWTSRLPGDYANLRAGEVPLFQDPRIQWFIEALGGVQGKNILELGPLEGGHTYMLEAAGAASIVAIEANSHAYLRCLIVKEILGLRDARFLCGDFVEHLRGTTQRYDACLGSGVLYHMTNPVELLSLLSQVTDRVCLWTHYYDESVLSKRPEIWKAFRGSETKEHAGYTHTLFHRYYEKEALGWQGFCGGSRPTSRWLSRDDILGCLRHLGHERISIGFDNPEHPNGPSFALTAIRE
jgi:hypothetical protein